jgi:GNAT superfamily N-acetyltransferase
MKIIKAKELTSAQKQALLELWNKEYPQELQYGSLSDLDRYLAGLEDQHHMLLLDDNDGVRGWYADFIREHERWFLVILDSEVQGRKFGARLMEMAKASNEELNGWVVTADHYLKTNGELYTPPGGFYQKQGFKLLEGYTLENAPVTATRIRWSKPRL